MVHLSNPLITNEIRGHSFFLSFRPCKLFLLYKNSRVKMVSKGRAASRVSEGELRGKEGERRAGAYGASQMPVVAWAGLLRRGKLDCWLCSPAHT